MSEARRPRRLSVAAQLLVLQLVIMVGVVGGVLWLSISQTLREFEAQEGRRTLSAAESLASAPLVIALLPAPSPADQSALFATVESVRAVGALTEAAVLDSDGIVLVGSDPGMVSAPAPAGYLVGEASRSWTGMAEVDGRALLLSRVPVYDESGTLIGAAIAARAYPGWPERLGSAAPDIALTVLVFAVIGFGGSYLLSRRLKRQTLGMEPNEIVGLVEHREALLHGVKEGVIAVDGDLQLTVLNDAARELLGWQNVADGRSLDETWVQPDLLRTLSPGTDDDAEDLDTPIVVGDRLIVANRRPIRSHGISIGAVTTLRDRTELIALRSELDTSRTVTDLLRAQTHEFANQLHTVSGLIQSEESDEALQFILGVTHQRDALIEAVTARIEDPPLTALLVAKATVAAERRVTLRIDEEAHLRPVDTIFSSALITVVGNLIDNAFDAVAGADIAEIDVDITDDQELVTITVQDSGTGLGEHAAERLFERGFSTKPVGDAGGRGYGLALTRQICRSHGGDTTAVDHGDGAVFVAVLRRPSPPSTAPERQP